jgi:hypothetical protein
MSENEDRIEGGKCDQAYEDYIARVTQPEPEPKAVCRSCGKWCPVRTMQGHICFQCDFLFQHFSESPLNER